MDAPLFTVAVKDLDYGDQELDEEIPVSWLSAAFANTEAKPSGPAGHLTATLSKTGREVMVRGRARAEVTLPCARTLDPTTYLLDAELFLLLEPRTERGGGPARKPATGGKAAREAAKPAPARPTKTRRVAGERGAGKRSEEPLLAEEDAAGDTYDGERVVLDAFVREVLLLELPAFPLREDLRSEATPAIDSPPEAAGGGRAGAALDPRLAPLAAIASRLTSKTSKKE